jgi:hypothetical protein
VVIGMRLGRGRLLLSFRSGALESLTEVLKVLLADLQVQHLFDHRQEVGQGADRAERRSSGRPYDAARRRQDEGILNHLQRHATLVQLGSEHPVQPTYGAGGARRCTIRVQQLANVVAVFKPSTIHQISPAEREAMGR